jgi:hypothetical protein
VATGNAMSTADSPRSSSLHALEHAPHLASMTHAHRCSPMTHPNKNTHTSPC